MLMLLSLLLIAARAPSGETKAALLQLQALDLRVATVSQRIATGGTSLCKTKSNWPGILVHDLSEYDKYRDAALNVFGLGVGTNVSVIVPGSPAARAGLRPRDAIESINGVIENGAEAVRKLLEVGGPFSITVNRQGHQLRIKVPAEAGCASRVVVIPSRKADAGADGTTVRIRSAIVDNTANDDELAFIIAHEMAHNILGHPQMLEKQGRRRARVLATEIEADQLGLKLMKAAGYDPHAAARFWTRFGSRNASDFFSDGTHQRTKDRVRDLEAGAKLLER
jgi:beta-barrel assembly-enhancing protease